VKSRQLRNYNTIATMPKTSGSRISDPQIVTANPASEAKHPLVLNCHQGWS
jgi:hypothetical protein